ncbi:MAG: hypothetical protein ACFCD0_10945 [Gemmataceae bacterium]
MRFVRNLKLHLTELKKYTRASCTIGNTPVPKARVYDLARTY